MLWRENRQVRVIAAMWPEKRSWSSRVTPRLLADGDGDTMEPSTVIEASIIGELFAGRKSSSVFPRFSFRWWVDIQAEMSARHAEICAGTWVSEGEKELKPHVLLNLTNKDKSINQQTCHILSGPKLQTRQLQY
ncbi:hypothetical protein AAFF_G00016950 [Aldrovandia affinis]|uniref:Uncharacterized protein n=1 Tax=Aldrovandia affinis TaxID=143900 RepID=A0AAD7WHV2_9TELE|nr:hypothetical protein AAFF_G00016950 [Aldrovandia affinis]